MNILDWKVVTIDDVKTIVYAYGDRYGANIGIVYLQDLINDVKKFGDNYPYTSTEARMSIIEKILQGLNEHSGSL